MKKGSILLVLALTLCFLTGCSGKTMPPTFTTLNPNTLSTTSTKSTGTTTVTSTAVEDYHHTMAQEVVDLINQARRENGIDELTVDNGAMLTAAKKRAQEITVHWAHERPDHTSWMTVFTEENVKYTIQGENLAKGQTTAQQAFNEWMDSPTHKANILQPQFTHISVACYEYNGNFYWAQLFGANDVTS